MAKKEKTIDSIQVSLRDLREKLGITQSDMAEACGISQPEISRMEMRKNHRVSTVLRFVEALGGELKVIVRMPDSKEYRIL